MDNNIDNQNNLDDNKKVFRTRFIITMLLIVAVIGIIGVTTSIDVKKKAVVNTGKYNVVIGGSTSVASSGLVPIANDSAIISYDNLSNFSNDIFVSTFTVKGAQTNPTDEEIIYDIALIDSDFDTSLLNKYLKWELIKNKEVIAFGDFSNLYNDQRYVLTSIQQDLPSYSDDSDDYDDYRFVIFINDNFDEGFDQKTMMGKSFTATIDIELYTRSKVGYKDGAVMIAIDNSKGFWQTGIVENITTITFKDNIDVPSTAFTETDGQNYWDLSDSLSERRVIAYLEDDGTGAGTYALTIGGYGGVVAPQDCSNYFSGMTRLVSINFYDNFDMSNVTNTKFMFANCSSLVTLDLSSFDTSNVTNMYGMFYYCSALTALDVTSFNTFMVTDMSHLFQGCSSLQTLDLSNFDTTNTVDMAYMFREIGLSTLNLSSFDTSNVTEMQYMFYSATNLTKLILKNFDTANVTKMEYMFSLSSNLLLDCSSWDVGNVTSYNGFNSSASGVTAPTWVN